MYKILINFNYLLFSLVFFILQLNIKESFLSIFFPERKKILRKMIFLNLDDMKNNGEIKMVRKILNKIL